MIFSQLQRIKLHNDVESWLPEDDPNARMLGWYHEHYDAHDRLLLSWDDSSLNDPRIAAFENVIFPEGQERTIPGVEEVTTPVEVIEVMLDNGVPREMAVQRLAGVLVGTGWLKVRLTEEGRQHREELIEALSSGNVVDPPFELDIHPPILPSSEAPLRTGDDAPSEDENSAAGEAPTPDWSHLPEGEPFPPISMHDFQIGWPGIHPRSPRADEAKAWVKQTVDALADGQAQWVDEIFFETGAPVALTVSINEIGEDELRVTMEAIRQAAEAAGIPRETLRMGGSPVGGSELNQAVLHAAWNPAYPAWMFWKRSPVLLSAVLGVLLAFIMLRSVRLATLVLTVSLYTTLATVALVPPTGGSMSMVLVVMPNLLMVLTMSGAIHVANYWRHAAAEDLPTSIPHAVRMARQPCAMASLTTSIGLASLATSLLTPVRDFGVYSAIGCLISLAMVLYGFPALLYLWPARKVRRAALDASPWRRLGRWIAFHSRPIATVSLLVTLIGSCGLYWFRTETKVIRYFPDHMKIIQDYNFLEENLAGIVPVTAVVAFDEQAQSEMDVVERMELVRSVEDRLREHPEISGTISVADFREPVEPLPEDASTRQRIFYARRVQRVEQGLFDPATGAREFVTHVTEPIRIRRAGEEVVFTEGDEIWKITAQVAVMSDLNYDVFLDDVDQILRAALAGHPGAEYVVTGTVPLFLRTQQAVLESLIRSFGLAFAVIAVVMIVVLRSVSAGLMTMIPNIMPVALVFGLVSWGGLAVDIGTMITASVALGIAVDGTLHLLTWFREGIRQGMSRSDSIAKALGHCGPAMWQTSTAVGLGLLALIFADLLLVSRFGWLMAALIGAALVADVIVLPALLAGPLGRLIERRTPLDHNGEFEHMLDSADDIPTQEEVPSESSVGETAR